MKRIGIFRAKTHLSDLCQEVSEKQSAYIIEKRGKPVAILTSVPAHLESEQPDILWAMEEWEKLNGPDRSKSDFPEVWKSRSRPKGAPELD